MAAPVAQKTWTAAEKIVRAKIRMRKRFPFFAHLLIWVDPRELEAEEPDTPPDYVAGITREGTMYYSRKAFEGYSDDTVECILAHEVLHPALGHFARQGARDRLLWNIAGDIKINAILEEAGMHPSRNLPENSLIVSGDSIAVLGCRICGISEKSVEEIYHELLQKAQAVSARSGKGKGDGGDSAQGWERHLWAEDEQPDESSGEGEGVDTEAKIRGQAQKWTRRLMDAQTHCEMTRGTVPGGIGELLKRLVDPQIDWRTYIEQFVERSLISDFSYRRPRKTYYDNGVYLPSVVRENLELVYHIDSSGSMSSEQLEKALGGLHSLLHAHANIAAWVVVCDAEIRFVERLTGADAPDILGRVRMSGRGGTSHEPVVKWINENVPDVNVFVSFTDGCSDIQQCYRALPDSCARLLVLTDGAHMRNELGRYAEIVTMGDSD